MNALRHSHHGLRMFSLPCLTAFFSLLVCAEAEAGPYSPTSPQNDAFYKQLLKLPESDGYRPTRTFTIVSDAENDNRLVAEDDANLRFNLLWMEQYRPGYKARSGGAALGDIFRSYVKTAYKAYRGRNAQGSSMLPDENGSLRSRSSYATEMDYNIRVTGDEVRLKAEYSF